MVPKFVDEVLGRSCSFTPPRCLMELDPKVFLLHSFYESLLYVKDANETLIGEDFSVRILYSGAVTGILKDIETLCKYSAGVQDVISVHVEEPSETETDNEVPAREKISSGLDQTILRLDGVRSSKRTVCMFLPSFYSNMSKTGLVLNVMFYEYSVLRFFDYWIIPTWVSELIHGAIPRKVVSSSKYLLPICVGNKSHFFTMVGSNIKDERHSELFRTYFSRSSQVDKEIEIVGKLGFYNFQVRTMKVAPDICLDCRKKKEINEILRRSKNPNGRDRR